jgi:formate dehydrogenase accessory protein FdhE
MEQPEASRSPWIERRRRALQLRERHPFAAEVLTLYLALLDVQEPAFAAAAGAAPERAPGLAREVLPRVIDATIAAGPDRLAEGAVGRFHSADLDDVIGRWLRGAEQSLVDRYLARAACAPVLEAMDPDALGVLCPGERGARVCPRCGGPPQLGFFALSGEDLVTGPRHLVCARCAASWVYPRMVCAGCGEETSGRLTVYSEAERFPHARIDACETCRRYVLAFDLRRDAEAVPVVDELASLPLDLYAGERGLQKVTPNLMGF